MYGALGTRTVAMSALGYQGSRQWDAHNLYGIAEAKVTAGAVGQITGQRPFVLSRCPSLPCASCRLARFGMHLKQSCHALVQVYVLRVGGSCSALDR